jgi:predicted PurR-regulated permease PerM
VLIALYVGKDVFLPITLAILLAFVLAPFVEYLRRWHLGRAPSIVMAVLVAVGILASLSGIIGYQVAGLAADIPSYQYTVKQKLDGLREGVIGRLPEMIRSIGHEIDRATREQPDDAAGKTPAQEPAGPQPLPVEVHQPDATPLELATNVIGPVLKPLATTGVVFVVLIFILFQREDLRDRMIRLFGSSDLHRTTVAMDDGARRLSRYFLAQLGLNAAFGVFIAIGLWLIGVPSPLLWGIFATLMRFIPYVGSVLAAVLPTALAAAVDPGWTMAIMAALLFLISEPIMGHVIEPLVYGQSTGLSPFAVVMAAIFWTWIWGPVGLLISTPLTLCLVVLGRHVERLEFLDVLLGDRPALTPAENLYQRMLAGDPDEALESAELLLKDRSLTSYYDEVALAGLQLAANDATRGVLTNGQLKRVRAVVDSLVHDLDAHEDVEKTSAATDDDPVAPRESEKPAQRQPAAASVAEGEALPEWRAPGAVMCIAGRGPLDEAAASMLVQLLAKHGLGSQLVPYESVSRAQVGSLDMTGVKMICISYLELGGTPAHLRYLMRRLRKRSPEAPILVGLWPSDDAVLRDERVRSVIGADHYVTTLREAVVRCVDAAKGDEVAATAGNRPGSGADTKIVREVRTVTMQSAAPAE